MFGILHQCANDHWEYRLLGGRAEGGDQYKVSNTIVKQGLEVCLGYCDNVPIAIGNTDYEEVGRKEEVAPMCLRPL